MEKRTNIRIINISYTKLLIFSFIITAISLSVFFYLIIQIPNTYANNSNKVLKILNQKIIQDQNNYKHLLGILKNIGNSSINDIIVSANLLDKANKTIGNFSKQSEITTLNPNDSSPFDILIYDKKIYDKINNFEL